MSGHLPAVSQILRKCLSGTEIDSGLFLRESRKFPVATMCFVFSSSFSLAIIEVTNMCLSAVVDSLYFALTLTNCFVCVLFDPHTQPLLRDCEASS